MSDPRWDVEQATGLIIEEDGDEIRLAATTDAERAFLANAAKKLQALEPFRVSPVVRHAYDGMLVLERFQGTPTRDELTWLWQGCRILAALTECGIKHGDLTAKNLVHDERGWPQAIDFQEAVYVEDGITTKRPESDGHHLWRAAVAITGDQDRRFRRWIAIRDHLGNGGLVDLGCAHGHFCRLAQVDSTAAWIVGVDHEFHATWTGLTTDRSYDRLSFEREDLFTFDLAALQPETALVLSTWPYLVEQQGWIPAVKWLQQVVRLSGQTFFEMQYGGDGPGPQAIRDDDEARTWFDRLGIASETLTTIPVYGRDASRTLWRLT